MTAFRPRISTRPLERVAAAQEMVTALAERGVVVSAAHSTATYVQAQAGLGAGIRYSTHPLNAMLPLLHRESGLAGTLLTHPRPVAGMIVDGIHTHPAMVKLAWEVLGPALGQIQHLPCTPVQVGRL